MFSIYVFQSLQVGVIITPLPLDGTKNMFPELNSGQAINLVSFAVELHVFLITIVVFLDLWDSVF